MDTKGETRWMGWIMRWGLTYIHYHVWNRSLMRIHFMAQGTLLGALWWPKWDRNPKKRRMFTYGWFTLWLQQKLTQQCKATIFQLKKQKQMTKPTHPRPNQSSPESPKVILSMCSFCWWRMSGCWTQEQLSEGEWVGLSRLVKGLRSH